MVLKQHTAAGMSTETNTTFYNRLADDNKSVMPTSSKESSLDTHAATNMTDELRDSPCLGIFPRHSSSSDMLNSQPKSAVLEKKTGKLPPAVKPKPATPPAVKPKPKPKPPLVRSATFSAIDVPPSTSNKTRSASTRNRVASIAAVSLLNRDDVILLDTPEFSWKLLALSVPLA